MHCQDTSQLGGSATVPIAFDLQTLQRYSSGQQQHHQFQQPPLQQAAAPAAHSAPPPYPPAPPRPDAQFGVGTVRLGDGADAGGDLGLEALGAREGGGDPFSDITADTFSSSSEEEEGEEEGIEPFAGEVVLGAGVGAGASAGGDDDEDEEMVQLQEMLTAGEITEAE